MIDFDTQDKYPLPSVRAWFRERFSGWGWYQWVAVSYCFLATCATVLAILIMNGCASSLASQAKGHVSGAASGAASCGQSWWQQIAGLGVLNWMGGLLILAGGVAFVGTFIPAVGVFFPRKMAVSCVAAGVASVFLYNLLTEYAWVVYITLGIGCVLLALSYWPSITSPKKFSVKVRELFTRKDEDGDGHIGPNE